jgi:hypothetical protein
MMFPRSSDRRAALHPAQGDVAGLLLIRRGRHKSTLLIVNTASGQSVPSAQDEERLHLKSDKPLVLTRRRGFFLFPPHRMQRSQVLHR